MQKDRESTLNTIIDNISKGVIISDCNDVIIKINNIAAAKLKLKSDVLGKTMKLVSQNEYLMNEEVFNMVIENEEYNVAGKIIPFKVFQ